MSNLWKKVIVSAFLWILTGSILLLLENSEIFSIVLGGLAGLSFFFYPPNSPLIKGVSGGCKIPFTELLTALIYLYVFYSLLKITSGRVALTLLVILVVIDWGRFSISRIKEHKWRKSL